METFSVLLALCEKSIGDWCFDVFFDLCMNKRLSKQSIRHRAHYDVNVMRGTNWCDYSYEKSLQRNKKITPPTTRPTILVIMITLPIIKIWIFGWKSFLCNNAKFRLNNKWIYKWCLWRAHFLNSIVIACITTALRNTLFPINYVTN